jgi:thioesterase domain-containing protein
MSPDRPMHDDSTGVAGDDLSKQILRISLTRLTRLAAELAKKENGRLQLQPGPGANNSALVPIQATGTTSFPPLFLMHPVGGSVMAYYQLARYLRPEQPVYAIENQVVFNPQARIYRTITEMATSYIEEIQTVRPQGPYLLGGYSMGGLVAFEMARQLMARAQEVRLLALIDTPAGVARVPETSNAAGALTPRDLIMMATIVAQRADRTVYISADELELIAPDQRVAYLVEALKSQQVIPPHVDAALFRELLAVVRNNEEAQRRYVPQPYQGPIDLFRAVEVSAELQREAGGLYKEPTFGWQAVCREPVTVNYVPGSHMRMMDQPHVQALGASLQRRLDRELRKRLVKMY